MANLADKFSRLTALKPTRTGAASATAGWLARPAARRAPEREDALSQLVGAAISTNRYGEHVSVSNWYSTPEFVEASSNTLDLLCRSRDVGLSKRTLAALSDPTKWLFLDTETTGLVGGTGTYAFLIGLGWWDSGGLQVEQLFMRDFHEE
ncbi:MAG: ribonuclease H-like domain-containing protein, partial [Acidobacteria bacterium]|nr:ribonuclease H-like domain-containing protein [Acidobacteriota bacterium]